MTKSEWLEMVKRNQSDLLYIVTNFHPLSKSYCGDANVQITAEGAERARQTVVKEIKESSDLLAGPPHLQLIDWVEAEKIDEIYNCLNDTWFGVPESTSCWKIRGFRELVSLLEDPPEEEE